MAAIDPSLLNPNRAIEKKPTELATGKDAKTRSASGVVLGTLVAGANGTKILPLYDKNQSPAFALLDQKSGGWDIDAIKAKLAGEGQALSEEQCQQVKDALTQVPPSLLKQGASAFSIVLAKDGSIQFNLDFSDTALNNSPFSAEQLVNNIKSGCNGTSTSAAFAKLKAAAVAMGLLDNFDPDGGAAEMLLASKEEDQQRLTDQLAARDKVDAKALAIMEQMAKSGINWVEARSRASQGQA